MSAQMANAMYMASNAGRAVEIADRVLAAAEEADMTGVVADMLITRGGALADLGRSYEGIGEMRTGLELARSADMPMTALKALANLVNAQIPRDPVAAVEAAREGLGDARRLSLTSWIAALVSNGIEAAQWTGEWSWAFDETSGVLAMDLDPVNRAAVLGAVLPMRSWQGESVEAELEEVNSLFAGLESPGPDFVSSVHAVRSHAALAAGRLEEARGEALELGRLSPGTNALAACSLAARAALWSGDVDAARSDLASLESTHAHGPAITLHKATIRAGIAALEGRASDALAGYREALREWHEAGLPVLEALTAIDMAMVLDGTLPEVQAAGATAREIFGRLGARPFLERLESALARRPTPSTGYSVPEVAAGAANEGA
jgi:hypothetical protein